MALGSQLGLPVLTVDRECVEADVLETSSEVSV